MSVLFDRLKRLFDEGHGVELPDLRDDARFAPPEVRPAAVLIAVTDRADPGVLLTHRPETMRAHPGPGAILIGPEGGFDKDEREAIRALPQAVGIALGPRILRAETAAAAAVTLWMGAAGDW